MKTIKLSDDEYELIMKLRENIKKRKDIRNRFNSGLQKELNKQERNMRKIAALRFNNDPQRTYHNAVESSYHKKIRKTITENGKVYEVILEDIGDGKGLVEKERKELGKANNINYRFSEMSNVSGNIGSESYSRMIKTETKNGKRYEVTYEDKGDGKGLKETNRKLIGRSNKNNKNFRRFNSSNIEKEFFKERNNLRKKFNLSNKKGTNKRTKYSYQKKTLIENIDGEAYMVTYENVNNEGFKEVNREKV